MGDAVHFQEARGEHHSRLVRRAGKVSKIDEPRGDECVPSEQRDVDQRRAEKINHQHGQITLHHGIGGRIDQRGQAFHRGTQIPLDVGVRDGLHLGLELVEEELRTVTPRAIIMAFSLQMAEEYIYIQ